MNLENLQDTIGKNLTAISSSIKPHLWNTINERFENWNEDDDSLGDRTEEIYKRNIEGLTSTLNLLAKKQYVYFNEDAVGFDTEKFTKAIKACEDAINASIETMRSVIDVRSITLETPSNMKTIKTVKFAVGVREFATEKEVTPQLVLDYINEVASGVYANARLVPYKEGGEPKVIVYDTDPYDEHSFTERIEYLVSTINLY